MADALAQLAGALYNADAPLNTNGAIKSKSILQKSIEDIKQVLSRDNSIIDPKALPALIDAVRNKDTGLDDRLLALELGLVVMSCLPDGNPISQKLQDKAIDLFYYDLPHPAGYIVQPKKYLIAPPTHDPAKDALEKREKYITYAARPADGSNYNPLQPDMGKAGMPYARTVPPLNIIPPSALPDPGLVFDTLLRRPAGTFKEHPAGISSLFFAFADLVIHSIFYTDHHDYMINRSSSYLDLSPLYGNDQATVDKVRRKDGSGKLWDDVFADARLRYMPPAVCALLVLFSRNHNYITDKLLAINEFETFVPLEELKTDADRIAQDNELFERARLINSGFFMQIILGDYVGAILGLARDRLSWRLDPLIHYRSPNDHSVTPRGGGSLVSVEFNIMYRWHSTISRQNEQWTANLFNHLFEGKSPDDATPDNFKDAAHKFMIPTNDIREWTFDKYRRDPVTKKFNDAELAKLLQDSTGARAAAFSARGVPECMRVIEILGIEQARAWGTCSMNEFRKFMGLKPFSNFEEWNSDKEIATAAARLYGSIDNLELSVGLQAEEAKKPGPGAGLCPGYTVSRAILADAVCLTRGDRFLTTEFTPYNLTSWGYQDCIQTDKDDGSYGGVLTKLLFRHLPDYYHPKSAYAHFPFLDPVFLKQEWIKRGHIEDVAKYNWDAPKLFKPTVQTTDLVGQSDTADRLYRLTGGLTIEKKPFKYEVGGFKTTTDELLKYKSFTRAGAKNQKSKFVDIVKDVINLLPVHWFSSDIAGLPLKTDLNPRGQWTEQDTYDGFASVAQYLERNNGPELDWVLREHASACYNQIVDATEDSLDYINGGLIGKFVGALTQSVTPSEASKASREFLAATIRAHPSLAQNHKTLAASIFAQLVPSAAHLSHVLSIVVDYYLDEKNKDGREQLVKAAKASDLETVFKLVQVALAENPPLYATTRRVMADAILKDGTKVEAGQRVSVDLKDTPVSSNSVFPGLSADGLMDPAVFKRIVPLVLLPIFSLKNIRLASTPKTFEEKWQKMYVDPRGRDSVFPCTLVVQYDV